MQKRVKHTNERMRNEYEIRPNAAFTAGLCGVFVLTLSLLLHFLTSVPCLTNFLLGCTKLTACVNSFWIRTMALRFSEACISALMCLATLETRSRPFTR